MTDQITVIGQVELEESLYKSKHHLSKEQERTSVLEKEGFQELRAVRSTVDGLRKRAEVAEETIEDLKEEKEQLELKLSQLTTTSTANINGLVAQLKAQEESMKQERERVKFDVSFACFGCLACLLSSFVSLFGFFSAILFVFR